MTIEMTDEITDNTTLLARTHLVQGRSVLAVSMDINMYPCGFTTPDPSLTSLTIASYTEGHERCIPLSRTRSAHGEEGRKGGSINDPPRSEEVNGTAISLQKSAMPNSECETFMVLDDPTENAVLF